MIKINVDVNAVVTVTGFCASLVLEAVGLPRELFTPTSAVGRVAGWTAHIAEQAGNNKIIRPSGGYTGPAPKVYTRV